MEFPVKEDKVNFLIYALKKGSIDVVLKKFEEMNDENVFGEPYAYSLETSFNMNSLLYNVSSCSNIKVANSFFKKFGHLLNEEHKAAFLFVGNKFYHKTQEALKNHSNTRTVLAKDFSKDEYDFVKSLNAITSNKESKNFLDNKFNLCLKPKDFFDFILSSEPLREKFENSTLKINY